jgi:paraquat-inducible protein B
MAESVTIRAFIRAPYDSYVNGETRFWNASGISVKLAGGGVEVQMESLRALLLGGIAFETPETQLHAAAVAANQVFPLFPDRDAANAATYTRKISAVSYFQGSVRGLAPGSEVTVHGLKVGRVLDVRLAFDPAKMAIVAPVHYEVDPERIVGVGARVFKTDKEAVEAMLRRGLRASLQSASLITGEQNVALEFVANAPPASVVMEGPDFVLPTTEGGGFAGLASSATELMNNVNSIPFQEIGDSLNGILKSIDGIAEGPQVKKAVADLAATLASAQNLIQHLDSGLSPAAKQFPEITTELRRTMTNANQLLISIGSGYGDDTKFHRDVDRLLAQLNDAVRSMRALADLLARHPEALIKGRPDGGPP